MSPAPVRYRVLATDISAVTLAQAVEIIAGWIARGERRYVNVCTAHTALECHDAADLARIVNRSGLAVPDGMPLVWLGRLRGLAVGRVYGPDLMLALCRHGLERGYRHFLYGATEDVLSRLEARLTARFPTLVVCGRFAPPFRALTDGEKDMVAEVINSARPDIVWVGLGTPKQDYWVAEFRDRLRAPALVAVGAAFDFHSGRIRQAPRWVMRAGLEWLARLLAEPRRLWQRYLLGNPRFVWLALRQAFERRGTAREDLRRE